MNFKPAMIKVGSMIAAINLVLINIPCYGAISENNSALNDISKPFKTKIFNLSDKKAPRYIKEFDRDQTPRQLGNTPIKSVERSESGVAPVSSQTVKLDKPPLRALISIENSFNPFSLDAQLSESINLEESLRTALNENLDIARNFSILSQRKYNYISSLSKFLPDINSGYTLAGIKGTLPGALLGNVPKAGGGAGTGSINLPGSVQLLSAGFTYHAYQGGRVLFGALQSRHQLRAARASLKGNINDVLLDTTKGYNDLLLNEALLDVRTQAVAISAEQVRLDSGEEKSGIATGLDVLQAQAQLASDQQNLIDQQEKRRQSGIQLATLLNASYALDLVSSELELNKRRLISEQLALDKLLTLAIDNRPELKQYEELRLAAKRAIVVQAAPLQPKVDLAGTVYGVGAGSNDMTSIKVLNFSVNWQLGGLGLTDSANIQAARWQAREAAIQARQMFQTVFRQVRTSYDQSLASEARIERADAQITAAEEELRIAEKRKQAGIGLNIDVLNAQRDRTQARLNKAQALIDFNNAQSQILHDIGLISIDTLLHGLAD